MVLHNILFSETVKSIACVLIKNFEKKERNVGFRLAFRNNIFRLIGGGVAMDTVGEVIESTFFVGFTIVD